MVIPVVLPVVQPVAAPATGSPAHIPVVIPVVSRDTGHPYGSFHRFRLPGAAVCRRSPRGKAGVRRRQHNRRGRARWNEPFPLFPAHRSAPVASGVRGAGQLPPQCVHESTRKPWLSVAFADTGGSARNHGFVIDSAGACSSAAFPNHRCAAGAPAGSSPGHVVLLSGVHQAHPFPEHGTQPPRRPPRAADPRSRAAGTVGARHPPSHARAAGPSQGGDLNKSGQIGHIQNQES